MKLTIQHQERFSRGELILRTFLGWLYIAIPHFFLLFFVGIWSGIITFIALLSILFTGRYPQSMFEFQVGLMKWQLRLNARIMNLADGYPAFGISGSDESTNLEVEYPDRLSRGLLIVKVLFGWLYVGIPHGFILFFRMIATQVLAFLAWWVVLITAKYPESFHEFVTGTIRWSYRVTLYMGLMSDDYPPFSGKEI